MEKLYIVWYVSNILRCTYLEDNYIVFENITASIIPGL
jgi:hypothetical protein